MNPDLFAGAIAALRNASGPTPASEPPAGDLTTKAVIALMKGVNALKKRIPASPKDAGEDVALYLPRIGSLSKREVDPHRYPSRNDALDLINAVTPMGEVTAAEQAAAKLAPVIAKTNLPRAVEQLVVGDAPAVEQTVTRNVRNAIRNTRHLDETKRLEAAKRGEHLIQAKNGQYVGAPRGATTPEHIQKLRDDFDANLDEGAKYGGWFADWYERAQQGIRGLAGRSSARRRGLAGELAVTSPQADPETNLGFALRGHNAIAAGQPAKIVRTGAVADKMRTAAETGQDIKQGLKTDPFSRNMIPPEDRTLEDIDRTVNDIWHLRNWGFKTAKGTPWNSGATPQMHAFVDAETMLATERANARALGGRADWTPSQVQALPWVVAKAKGLQKRFPKRYAEFTGYLDEAAKSYPDFFEKHTANATYEAIPGRGVGHREDILSATKKERNAFANRPSHTWTTPDNRDVLYDAAGMYQRPTRPSQGMWHPDANAPYEFNPANVARPLVSFENGAMDAPSRSLLGSIEHYRAFNDAQRAGAAHVILPKKTGANSLFIPLQRKLKASEMKELMENFEPRGYGVVDSGKGFTISPLFANEEMSGVAPKKAAQLGRVIKTEGWDEAISQMIPDAKELHRVNVDGVYEITKLDKSRGKGTAVRALLAKLNRVPGLMDKLSNSPDVRQMARNRYEAAVADKAAGKPVRDDFIRALKALSEGGPNALKIALKAGVSLPALGLMLNQSDER